MEDKCDFLKIIPGIIFNTMKVKTDWGCQAQKWQEKTYKGIIKVVFWSSGWENNVFKKKN